MIHNPRPKRNTHLRNRPSFRFRYVGLAVIALGLLCVTKPTFSPQARVMEPSLEPASVAAIEESAPLVEPEPAVLVTARVVRKGDTLYDILKAGGLSDTVILEVDQVRVDGIRPSKLVAGKSYRLYFEEEQLVEYQYEPDDINILKVVLGEGTPVVTVEPIPYEIVREAVSGIIEASLFAAVESIGEKAALAMDLADIFAWQVDFFRDLRKGDSFSVLVDKYYRDGKFVRYGQIEAARFVNNGTSHMAFLYNPENGRSDYFDETGGSLRKQFLKAPLRFRRISSSFSTRRRHPVTGKVVPHLGVDYAAPTGTPIMSIGDGKVVMAKRDSVNGRIIKVRHNSVYSSAYLHMNSFASGMKVGTRVHQGQVIGYVGSTGRATGPHLHFAMYRNGKYADPRRISVPRATSVPKADLEQFKTRIVELDQEIEDSLANKLADRGAREAAVDKEEKDVLR